MKVILIGSGNVATALGKALLKANHEVVQVYGRNESSAKTLSRKLSCSFTTEVKRISEKANIYIVALRDEAIESFLQQFKITDKIIVHTSGSVPMKVFGKKFKNAGVFYP